MPRELNDWEAANFIRSIIGSHGMSMTSPEDYHRLNYYKKVVRHLGQEVTPESVAQVSSILSIYDITPLDMQEYPKFVKRGSDGADVIVHDKREEDEVVNSKVETDKVETDKVETDKVETDKVETDKVDGAQGDVYFYDDDTEPNGIAPSLDLKDKVPMVKPAEHPAGRAPDEETNKAAAQTPAVKKRPT